MISERSIPVETSQSDNKEMSPVKKRKLTLILSSSLIVLILAIIPAAAGSATFIYGVLGAIIGMTCTSIIFYSSYVNRKKEPTSELLLFRSICDFGLAIRFLCSPVISRKICGDIKCTYDEDTNGNIDFTIYDHNEDVCALPSAIMEFFEIASEAWFFCLAWDLSISVTNPFSTLKGRIKSYHALSWVLGLTFAAAVGFDRHMHGFWSVAQETDKTAFCWINDAIDKFSWRPWAMFYIPILIVYTYTCTVMFQTFMKLRGGISTTFQHRMRVLVSNSINAVVFIIYWTILLIMYGTLLVVSPTSFVAGYIYKYIIFSLSAKGFADFIVWVLCSDFKTLNSINIFERGEKINSSKSKTGISEIEEELILDLNSALRKEVLLYATAGIRESAKRGPKASEKDGKIILELRQLQSGGQPDSLNVGTLLAMIFNLGEDDGKFAPLPTANVQKNRRFSAANVSQNPMAADAEGGRSSVQIGSIRQSEQTVSARQPDALRKEISLHEMRDPPAEEAEIGIIVPSEAFVSTEDEKAVVSTYSVSHLSLYLTSLFSATDKNNMNRRTQAFIESNEQEGTTYSVFFAEYEPYHYRRVRHFFGVDDNKYMETFKATVKERLVEGGASGAFFFFSKGEEFIAKSCTLEEIENLCNIAERYANYMCKPGKVKSYITKVYGVYMLRIYGISLYFLVMNNLFLSDEKEVINEKYDIKGSYIKRNATLPREGNDATCSHCNQRFIYKKTKAGKVSTKSRSRSESKSQKGSSISISDLAEISQLQDDSARNSSVDPPSRLSAGTSGGDALQTFKKRVLEEINRCPVHPLGFHEPNVVLKDNDLKYKLRLHPIVARALLDQLRDDTEFLKSLGVMDYSLLIGVHNTHYDVHLSDLLSDSSSVSSESPIVGSNKKVLMSGGSVGLRSSSLESEPLLNCGRRVIVSKVVGPEAYYIGIVDFQQQYNFSKKLELYWKSFRGAEVEGLSCIEPVAYQSRFMRRMEEIIDCEEYDVEHDL